MAEDLRNISAAISARSPSSSQNRLYGWITITWIGKTIQSEIKVSRAKNKCWCVHSVVITSVSSELHRTLAILSRPNAVNHTAR